MQHEEKTAVFIACDRVKTYISYFKKRRPELFHIEKKDTFNLTEDEIFDYGKEIYAEEVETYIEEYAPLIIDTRGALSFQIGSIHPSAINIPQYVFENMFSKTLPFSKDKEVLLLCASGHNTKKFSALINMLGGRAKSLHGGMAAWVRKNGPLL